MISASFAHCFTYNCDPLNVCKSYFSSFSECFLCNDIFITFMMHSIINLYYQYNGVRPNVWTIFRPINFCDTHWLIRYYSLNASSSERITRALEWLFHCLRLKISDHKWNFHSFTFWRVPYFIRLCSCGNYNCDNLRRSGNLAESMVSYWHYANVLFPSSGLSR